MITIDNEKRLNWHKIRGEYIAGGISQRKLAEKYGISFSTIQKKCQREKWAEAREAAKLKVAENVVQKTAEAAADNAAIAASIKRKGLLILDKLFDDFSKHTATEHRESGDGVTDIKRLRDLTGAYKDLTEDIAAGGSASNELLKSLLALERQAGQ